MTKGPTRRKFLKRGLGGVSVLAAGGLVWRAWDKGVFSVGAGPAYELWHGWRSDAPEGPIGIVQAGILASNAHNTQPWRFLVTNERIALFADHDRHLGSFDPFRREMALSLGCAIENMVHTAEAQGQSPRVDLVPDRLRLHEAATPDEAVAVIHLAPDRPRRSDLFAVIARRHTHRGSYDPERPVPASLQDEMRSLLIDRDDIRLFLFDGGPARTRLGEIIVAATEDIVADHQMAMDSAQWFRFDWRSVQRHRDGVTLDAVGLPPLVNALAKIIPAPAAEQADRQWLDGTRNVHVATAPLLGMIAVRDLYDRATALEAGRLWQRLHLWATMRGLVAQPLNQPAEMVDRERERDIVPRTAEALAELTGDARWHPTFVFRTGYADHPARLSPRRPVESVLLV